MNDQLTHSEDQQYEYLARTLDAAMPCANCTTPLRRQDLPPWNDEKAYPPGGSGCYRCLFCGAVLRFVVPIVKLTATGFYWELVPGQVNPEVAGPLIENMKKLRKEAKDAAGR